jgi:hypothetical protein
MVCLRSRRGMPGHFESRGTQNVENHLWKEQSHWDPLKRRAIPSEKKGKRAYPSVIDTMGLTRTNPWDRAIANKLIESFDRKHFHTLCVNWAVDAQLSFRAIENPRLRLIFEYLNPSVKVQDAHLSRKAIRDLAVTEHAKHIASIKEALHNAVGQIHIAFDGARSRNRHALFGVTATFMSDSLELKKVVLGVPELVDRHTGDNIAAEILEVINEYEIGDKVGYFTLDNAANNDTAMEALGNALGFSPIARRVRCMGHVINLVVKALLFGHNDDAFDDLVDRTAVTDARAAHDAWMKKGPVGKAHNFVVWVHRSDILTNKLRKLQSDAFESNPDEAVDDQGRRRSPVDVIIDNDTRWLSQYYMIKRLIRLRPYYDDFIQWARRRAPPCIRQSPCLEETSFINDNDWAVLEAFHDLLHDFHIVVMRLEGDGQSRQRSTGVIQRFGLMTDVLMAFELLLGTLEKTKSLIAEYPEPEQFAVNINLGWDKLNQYYQYLVDSPVYYAAVALHPAYRWQYFYTAWNNDDDNITTSERARWLQDAKSIVQALWDRSYRDLDIPRQSPRPSRGRDDEHGPPRKKPRLSTFAEYQESHRIKQSAGFSQDQGGHDDEYARWQSYVRPGDPDVRDPIAYWISNQDEYPKLSRMALDVMTVPAMSAECERLFSAVGLMVTPLRTRLDASTIGTIQSLRSWLQAGLIGGLDPTLLDVTCKDEALDDTPLLIS